MKPLVRTINILAAVIFGIGIAVSCDRPGSTATGKPSTGPGVSGNDSTPAVPAGQTAVPPTAALAATAPALSAPPVIAPVPVQTDGAIMLQSPEAAQTQPVVSSALLDDAKRAHEQDAQVALANLQGLLANKDYDGAQRLADACVKNYADTSVAGRFPPLLDQAKSAGSARTAGATDATRHAQFTTARDAGVAAMDRQDYPAAITQFQQALALEDDAETRGMLQHASNYIGKPRIAVAEFDVVGDVGIPDAGKAVPELMLGRFDPQRFQLVDRAWLDSILAQQGLSVAQIAQMPELLRVRRVDAIRYLVVGSISRLGTLTVSARLVDVSTGQIVQTADIAAADALGLQNGLAEMTAILQMSNEEKANYLAFRQRQVDSLATADPSQQAAAQAQCQQALDAQRQQVAQQQQITFQQAQHERDAAAALDNIKALLGQANYADALRYIHWARDRFADTSAAQELAAMDSFAQSKYQEQVAQQANAAAYAQSQAALAARHQRFVQDRDQGMAALAAGDMVNALTLLQNALAEEDSPYVRGVLDYVVRRMQRPGIAVLDFDVRGDVGMNPREAPRWMAGLLLQQFTGADSPYRAVDRWELQADLARVGLTMDDVRRDPLQPRMRMLREQIRFIIVGTATQGSIDVATVMLDLETGRPVQSAEFVAQDIRALPTALAGTAQVLQMTDDQKVAYLNQLAFAGWMARGDDAAAAMQWDAAVDAYAHACQLANTQDAQDHLAGAMQQREAYRQFRFAYDRAMAAAVDAARRNDWERALDLYRQAYSILPTPEARAGFVDARTRMIAAARDRHALYLSSMAAGDAFTRNGDLDRALDAYQQAYQVEATQDASASIAQVQRTLSDRQQAKQRAYAGAMGEARSAIQAGNWVRALDAYGRAAAILDTREASAGIAEARRKIAQQEADKKVYDKYMADAQTARTAGDWPTALDAYQHAALVMNTGDVQAAIAQAKKQIALTQQQNQKKIYDTAMANAQAHVTAGQWQDALVDYRTAYQADKTREAAAGIAQATKMINDAAYNKKQYDAAMAAADAAARAGQWPKALASYQQAASIDATADAKAGIDKAKQQIAAAAAADKQRQYTQFMSDGDAAVRAGDLQKALVAYNKAAAVNNTPLVQAALADVQKKLTDAAAAAEKKKQYDAALAAADAAAKAGQWQKALDNYTKAAGIDNTAAAQAGLANAKAKLDAAAAATMVAADRRKQFDTLMADGDAAAKTGDWQKALDAYNKAQAIDNTPAVQADIANAKKKISDAANASTLAAAAAEKKKKYDGLMADAAAAGKAGDWPKALTLYTQAQAVDNTADVKTAIADAKKRISDAAAATMTAANAEKKRQYDAAMAAAVAAAQAGNWQLALDDYNKAQAIDNTNEVKSAIANARQKLADSVAATQAAEKKRQYDAAMAAAAAAAQAGNWQLALDDYTKAQAINNTNEVKAAIANAKQKIADSVAATQAAEKKRQYDAAMAAAVAAAQAGNWQLALDDYTKAQAINNTNEVKSAIANAKQKIADSVAATQAAEKKRQYDAAMAAAAAAGQAGNWQGAIDNYSKAQTIDNTPEVRSALSNARQKLAEANAATQAAEKKRQYDAAMAAAAAAAQAGNWQTAIDGYAKAQGIDNTVEVRTALANARQKLAEANAAAQAAVRKRQYDAAMAAAAAAAQAGNWQTAIDNYTKAQSIDNTAEVKAALADARQKLADTADAAARKRQYTQFMTDGDNAVKASQWQRAIDAYTKAAAIDNSTDAQAGIASARQKLADAAAAASAAADKKKQLDQAIADGDAAGRTNDWQAALDAYTKAAGIDNTSTVQQKIANAKQKLFTKLMSDGDTAGRANDWQTALNDYNKAQALNNTAAVQTAISNAKKKLGQ